MNLQVEGHSLSIFGVHRRWVGPVRLRTDKTKDSGSRVACLTMVFKLAESASRTWRRLRGYELIPEVIRGVVFVDGVKTERAAA